MIWYCKALLGIRQAKMIKLCKLRKVADLHLVFWNRFPLCNHVTSLTSCFWNINDLDICGVYEKVKKQALHPYCLIWWVYAVEFTELGAISLLHVYLSSVYLSQSLWGYPFDAGITQHITIITSCRPAFTPRLITLKTNHTVIHQTSS